MSTLQHVGDFYFRVQTSRMRSHVDIDNVLTMMAGEAIRQ
jgi:hypothetical protein